MVEGWAELAKVDTSGRRLGRVGEGGCESSKHWPEFWKGRYESSNVGIELWKCQHESLKAVLSCRRFPQVEEVILLGHRIQRMYFFYKVLQPLIIFQQTVTAAADLDS